jgi:hypothetical protein
MPQDLQKICSYQYVYWTIYYGIIACVASITNIIILLQTKSDDLLIFSFNTIKQRCIYGHLYQLNELVCHDIEERFEGTNCVIT